MPVFFAIQALRLVQDRHGDTRYAVANRNWLPMARALVDRASREG